MTITATPAMSARPSEAAAGQDWLRDPAAIYARSFAMIEREADLAALPPALRPLAVRLVHSCGMADIVRDLAWSGEPVMATCRALATGAPILVDARMVAAGISAEHLPASNPILCPLADPRAATLAAALATTRSAAAVELWRPQLAGAVVAIGNAPTALFHLLERLSKWPERPAAILAFPVGFVGAAESKDVLIAQAPVPFVTLRGRRGGSALAAAAVNACARLSREQPG
jgi:precorrin-8X/cobalt-precorrin-8 methylmutase